MEQRQVITSMDLAKGSEILPRLRQLAREKTPTRVIGLKLGRTPDSVYSKASEENIPLKPTNQSPYNRRKR